MIVALAVSAAVTLVSVPETVRPMVNLSFGSSSRSSMVATVKVLASPARPANGRGAVFAV